MSEPFLYLEDLVKAEVPKPPKSIGGGAKAPGARSTLAGGPQATPAAGDKAQALAGGPLKRIEAPAPHGGQTLSQKNPNPPVSPAAKEAATITYEYWSGDGSPPSSGGWEKGPEGGWRRPEGSGGGGKGEAENLISDMKPAESEDPAVNQKAAQETDKKLVSSGDKETTPVSSSAEKIEASKQAESAANQQVSDHIDKVLKDEKNFHKDSEKKVRAEAKKAADKEAKEAKSDVAVGADGKPKGKPADTRSADEIEMAAGAHKKAARTMLSDMQAHLESGQVTDPVDKKHLEATIKVLEQQSSMPGVPGKDDTAKLKLAAQIAKQHGVKPPKPEEEPKEQVSKTPKKNYGAIFDAGRAVGEQVGTAAATLEGGGGLASSVINYGSSGAVRGGHHLLQGGGKAEATEAAPKKAPAKGAEVEQSSMKTEKSLPLYLDLDILKAVNAPNIGNTTPTESRARIKHESSYAKRPVGVANEGIVTEDDPDEGKQWKHSDEDSVEADVDARLKKEGEEDEDENEDENEEETEKALLADPSSLLKSLNTEVRNELNRVLPSDHEISFMVDVLHYDPALVSKGQKNIMGRDRHLFNEWMQGRLSKSISLLTERIVIK